MTQRTATFGKRGGGGRRDKVRVEAGMPAMVITLGRSHRALLVNISTTGARVCVEDPPKKGSEVFLQLDGLKVFARIVWKSGEQCGLRFDQEIREFDVSSFRRDAAVAAKAGMNPQQKGGADDWNSGVAR